MKIINKIIKSELISWQELKKYEFNQLKDNSNRDIKKLKNSIINQGFSFALCNWADHKFIIDGTGRHLALLELEKEGYEIPDLVVNQIQAENIKEAKKLALMVSSQHGQITQTSLADFTSLDFEIEELKELALEELNLGELDFMIGNLEPEVVAQEDDFEAGEVDQIKTDIVKGDLFEFRKGGETLHRLLCGDSTDSDQVAKLMNGEKADMVFTDPPYGANMGIQGDKANEFKQVFSDFISILPCEDNIYVCSDWRCVGYFINEIEKNNYEIYNLVIWVKNLFGQGKLYHTKHEEIIFCGKGNYRKDKLNDDVNVWQADSVRNFGGSKNAQEAVGHPTQKPVEICSRAINNSSIKNEIVYDGFLGSGSTMVASHQLKRKCYGMELDEKYCQVICDRMKKLDSEIEIIKI